MKKSFILYNDQEKLFEQLTDAEAGVLIKAVFKYLNMKDGMEDGAIEHYLNNRMLFILFGTLIQQIERDREKYAEKCKKLRENGSKGGKARADNMKQMQANVSLNDNDNVNPNINEIEDWAFQYAIPNGLSQVECMDKAKQAHDYYTKCMKDMNKRTWCDSSGKQIKNWKLKIARVWFKDLKPNTEINVNRLNVC